MAARDIYVIRSKVAWCAKESVGKLFSLLVVLFVAAISHLLFMRTVSSVSSEEVRGNVTIIIMQLVYIVNYKSNSINRLVWSSCYALYLYSEDPRVDSQ
jgi:hypothetical protein